MGLESIVEPRAERLAWNVQQRGQGAPSQAVERADRTSPGGVMLPVVTFARYPL